MKVRNFIMAALAVLMTLVACEPAVDLGLPSIKIDGNASISFDADGGDKALTITATRDWMAEFNADWIMVSPEAGKGSPDAQTVTVTAKQNTGMDRSVNIKFTIGMSFKTVTVTQKGPGGSAEALVVYANNFDKTKAEKGSSWSTYLDTFHGWHNEEGTGKSTVTYGFQKVTARTNSANGSGGQHSLYTELGASGMNYLWLGTAPTYFAVKNITLPEGKTDYTLSFGTERYEFSETETIDNTFNWDEFKVYVSADAQKWVKLSCDFAGGSLPVGKWDLASSTFTVPARTQKLHVYFTSTTGSAYAIDDVKLVQASAAGTVLDFAAGEAFEVPDSNTSGGDDSGNTGDVPEGTGEGTLASPYSAAKAWHMANALGESDNLPGVYVQGTVVEIKEVSTDFGNATYYITDADGAAKFYVYRGKYLNNESFTSQDQIKVGDNVVIYGDLMNYKGNSPQLGQGNYIVKINGSEGSAPELPESNGEKTVAEFIETADDASFYTLTGTVSNFNSQYFSFDLTDDSGSIYVYSVSSASKSQWKGVVGNGSVVTIIGKYLWYEHATDASKNKHEVIDAWIVEATQGDAEVTPPAGEAGEYDPQGITWTVGANAYDKTTKPAQTAVVNGVEVTNLLKLGKSDADGSAVLKVPAGTSKIGFYGLAWSGKTAVLTAKIAGEEIASVNLKGNSGATGNPKYTITVTDEEYFEIDIPTKEAVDVEITSAGRCLLIALKAIAE